MSKSQSVKDETKQGSKNGDEEKDFIFSADLAQQKTVANTTNDGTAKLEFDSSFRTSTNQNICFEGKEQAQKMNFAKEIPNSEELDEEIEESDKSELSDVENQQKELLRSRSESKKHVQQIEQEIIQQNKLKAALRNGNQVSIDSYQHAMSSEVMGSQSFRDSKVPLMQHSGNELETKAETIVMNERQFDYQNSGMISENLTDAAMGMTMVAGHQHQQLLDQPMQRAGSQLTGYQNPNMVNDLSQMNISHLSGTF